MVEEVDEGQPAPEGDGVDLRPRDAGGTGFTQVSKDRAEAGGEGLAGRAGLGLAALQSGEGPIPTAGPEIVGRDPDLSNPFGTRGAEASRTPGPTGCSAQLQEQDLLSLWFLQGGALWMAVPRARTSGEASLAPEEIRREPVLPAPVPSGSSGAAARPRRGRAYQVIMGGDHGASNRRIVFLCSMPR